jgi:hypothetical protein
MKHIRLCLLLTGVLGFALITPAFANWMDNGVRVASIDGGNVVVTGHGGSATDNFTVDANTVVQLEVAGSLSDVQLGENVRLIVPERRIERGETEITVKRIQILEVPARKVDDDPTAGYGPNYVQGVVTSLSPYLQIQTPGGLTVTAALANSVQVITYRFGSLGDIVDGATIDVDLHKDKDTGLPLANKIWIWDVRVN